MSSSARVLVGVLLIVSFIETVQATHPEPTGPTLTNGPSGADMDVELELGRYPGNATVLEIRVVNRGGTVPENASLRGTLTEIPGGWTAQSAECRVEGTDLSCAWPSWFVDNEAFEIVSGTTSCDEIDVSVAVTASNDAVRDNNTAFTSIPDLCGREADLTTDVFWWGDGDEWGFNASAFNLGPNPATNASLEMDFFADDSNLTWQTAPPVTCDYSTDTSVTGGRFTCDLGTVEPGSTVFLNATSTSLLCGRTVTAWSDVSAENELYLDNNLATDDHDPPPCPHEADLVLSLEAWRGNDTIGWFQFTLENLGPNASRTTYLQAYLVNYLEDAWTIADGDPACYIALGHDLECPLEDVPVGATRVITIREARPSCALLSVSGEVSAQNEFDFGSNYASAQLEECDPSTIPTTTSPSATIPFFPSSWAFVLGAAGAMGGAFMILRRRHD